MQDQMAEKQTVPKTAQDHIVKEAMKETLQIQMVENQTAKNHGTRSQTMKSALSVVGWQGLIPQLTAFYTVVANNGIDEMMPINMMLTGKPGTNKTEGAVAVCQHLGHVTSCVDMGTIDDVSELAGIVDLHANRQEGISRFIEGQLLKAEIFVADELANTRDHVMSQLRQLLQRKLVLLGNPVNINWKAIVATGNLQEDLLEGQARLLDSAMADRMALIVRVPSLSEMNADDQEAILEGRTNNSFAYALDQAMEGVRRHHSLVESECGRHVTRYVKTLCAQIAGTPFAFEGRRGKLLRKFLLVATALCRAQPERSLNETMWLLTRDCLSYHRLSGVDLDMSQLKAAHEGAFQAMGDISVESLILAEADLNNKVALVVEHLADVGLSPVTKADIFGQVMASNNVPMRLALLELTRHPKFAGQPAELRALIERMQFPFEGDGVRLGAAELAAICTMTQAELIAFEIAGGDQSEMRKLLAKMQEHLVHWAVG